VAAGMGLLMLGSKRRPPGPAGPTTPEEAARIVRESKEIVQGSRESYSDAPGVPVTPREAAERVKDTIASKPPVADTTDAELAAAIAAAKKAAAEEARAATSPIVGPIVIKPVQPAQPVQAAKPAQPAQPVAPAGYDRTKAANSAGDLARHIAQKKYDYTRKALIAWQTVAGIPTDGVYGPSARNALAYYVGAAAPKALFVKNPKTGAPYPNTPYPWGK
jgi:hypothetical protein